MLSEVAEQLAIGGGRHRQALGFSVCQQIAPVAGVAALGNRISRALTRGRVTPLYMRGGVNFWGLGAFIRGRGGFRNSTGFHRIGWNSTGKISDLCLSFRPLAVAIPFAAPLGSKVFRGWCVRDLGFYLGDRAH